MSTFDDLDDISSGEDNAETRAQSPVLGDTKNNEKESEDETEPTADNIRGRKRKSFNYTHSHDAELLKEVITEKPVGRNATQKWIKIFENLQFGVPNYRSLINRFNHLLDAHKKDMLRSLRSSGTEEDYDEKVKLLTDITEQIEDWKTDQKKSKKEQNKLQMDQENAKKIRDASLRTLSDPKESPATNNDPTPVIKRRKRRDLTEILERSEEAKIEQEKKRLELQEREILLKEENDRHRREMEKRQLELEEKRLDLENQKMQKEKEEKSLLLQLLEKQLK